MVARHHKHRDSQLRNLSQRFERQSHQLGRNFAAIQNVPPMNQAIYFLFLRNRQYPPVVVEKIFPPPSALHPRFERIIKSQMRVRHKKDF